MIEKLIGNPQPIGLHGKINEIIEAIAQKTDAAQAAHAAMPAPYTNLVELTILESGEKYTAKDDGWIFAAVSSVAGAPSTSYISLQGSIRVNSVITPWNNPLGLNLFLPIRKSQEFVVSYSNVDVPNSHLYFCPSIGALS